MTSKPTAVFIAAVLLGISAVWYERQRAAGFQQQLGASRAQQPSAETEAALARERDRARAELKHVAAEAVELQAARADLLKLRGEANVLRRETRGNEPAGGASVAGSQANERKSRR